MKMNYKRGNAVAVLALRMSLRTAAPTAAMVISTAVVYFQSRTNIEILIGLGCVSHGSVCKYCWTEIQAQAYIPVRDGW